MKQTFLTLFLVVGSILLAFSQRTITGKVTDEKGESLVGASVFVAGTSSGTVTDVNGDYYLQVPSGATTIS